MGDIEHFFEEYNHEILISLAVIGGLTVLYCLKRFKDSLCFCSKCCK